MFIIRIYYVLYVKRDIGCFEMNVSDFYESHRFIKKDNQLIIHFQYDY